MHRSPSASRGVAHRSPEGLGGAAYATRARRLLRSGGINPWDRSLTEPYLRKQRAGEPRERDSRGVGRTHYLSDGSKATARDPRPSEEICWALDPATSAVENVGVDHGRPRGE